MSLKVGDLVKLHLGDRWSPQAMAVSKPSRTARLAKWSGEITALYEVWLEGWKGGEKLAHVEPPIIWRPGKEGSWDTMCVETLGSARTRRPTLKTRRCAVDPDTGEFVMIVTDQLPSLKYTTIPVGWLEKAKRPKRPKSAAKGRPRKKGAEWKAKRQETLKTIELQKDDEDDAWFLDARTGELEDADADFHDAADTREKTLSAAVQSDLAQARSKRKGGRGRRRRRKRTRRTRRRKKRRTRRRRRKRTRRRRRR
jgi:hypothetical protein